MGALHLAALARYLIDGPMSSELIDSALVTAAA
jgi:hypothetical protein